MRSQRAELDRARIRLEGILHARRERRGHVESDHVREGSETLRDGEHFREPDWELQPRARFYVGAGGGGFEVAEPRDVDFEGAGEFLAAVR
jgi:hypothetical protein